ncbi:MAG: nucleotidyltransferase family protein [Candidatus Omnitrophota bacterium]
MVSCILLAAGESARFGSPKPLARLGPLTVIESILKNLLGTALDEIILVLGANAKEITAVLPPDKRLRAVTNEEFRQGQTLSFKKGLRALTPLSGGVMLLPVDMPCIRMETFDLLLKTFSKHPDRILIPSYRNKNGHPPIFPIVLKEEFLDLENTEPVSTIQRRHAEQILCFPVEDQGVVLSFNTPTEFQKVIKKISSGR